MAFISIRNFSRNLIRLVRPHVRNQFSVLNPNFVVTPPFDSASINQVRGRRWSLLHHLANGLYNWSYIQSR